MSIVLSDRLRLAPEQAPETAVRIVAAGFILGHGQATHIVQPAGSVQHHALARYFDWSKAKPEHGVARAVEQAKNTIEALLACAALPAMATIMRSLKPDFPVIIPAGDGAFLGSLFIALRLRSAAAPFLDVICSTWVEQAQLWHEQRTACAMLVDFAEQAARNPEAASQRLADALHLNAKRTARAKIFDRYAAAGLIGPEYTIARGVDELSNLSFAIVPSLRYGTLSLEDAVAAVHRHEQGLRMAQHPPSIASPQLCARDQAGTLHITTLANTRLSSLTGARRP